MVWLTLGSGTAKEQNIRHTTYVPFGGFVGITPHLGVQGPQNPKSVRE